MVRSLLLMMFGAATMFAGGFVVEFGNPDANSDPQAKGAAAIVRAVGCHSPEKAVFSGTAEGIVDGHRQSIPLKLVPLSTEGMFAVRQDWPKEGSWVLTISSTVDGQFMAQAVVPVSAKGVDRAAAKSYHRRLTEGDIAQVLH